MVISRSFSSRLLQTKTESRRSTSSQSSIVSQVHSNLVCLFHLLRLRNFPSQVSPAKTPEPPEFLTEIPRRQIPCLKRACIPFQCLPIPATQRALRLCLSFSSRRVLSPSSMVCLSFSFSDSRFEHFEPKHIPAPGELGPLLTTNDH